MKHIFGAKSKLLVSLLALICILAVGGTMAYLFASTNPLTNTFSSVELNTGIVETGTGTDKTVTITNKGKSPAWVRARLLVSGIDPKNVVILSSAADADEVKENQIGLVMLYGNDNQWQTVDNYDAWMTNENTDGGWIYYQSALPSGDKTSELLSGVVFGPKVNANDISITVTHESVLALDTNSVAGEPAYVAAFDNPAGSVPTT